MMTHNPFRYLQHVAPQDFVGRWPLIDAIANDLMLPHGDSHAIIAGQRFGKTSILSALAHQLRQSARMEPEASLALPLSIDFKVGAFDSAEAVFAFILNQIYRQINTAVHQHAFAQWSAPLRLNARWFERLLNASQLSQNDLEDGLGYLLDQLDTALLSVRLILLLDEIGKSFNQPWTETLYGQSRALICNSDLRTRLRLVLTASHHFLDQRNVYSTPLCNVLKLHYLESFDERGMNQLIARAPDLPAETALAIRQQSGGHPFLAQYLLYHLWEQVGAEEIQNAQPAQIERLVSIFQHQRLFELEGWAQLVEPEGLCAYQVLSTTEDWVAESQIIATVGGPAPAIKRSLLALCCHGLVQHSEDWSHYKYSGELFRSWFNRYRAANLTCYHAEKAKVEPDYAYEKINILVNTGGGPYIAGDVNTAGGRFIGRDSGV